MLVTGQRRGVLLSYTATHGMAVLRLRRDDAYCKLMLTQLARVQARYVCAGEEPGRDCGWQGDAQFMEFLRKTKALRTVGPYCAASIEHLVPTPATPLNAAGAQLFL